jgi:Putative metal-binding motif/FG-GAP repeat
VRVVSLALVLLLSACAGRDADGDGWMSDQGDCDDDNAAVYPGAAEVCGGIDDDCDGLVDDDDPDLRNASEWFEDIDGDGYGDPDLGTASCDAPAGSVADDTDCDDERNDVYPGAAEDDCTDPVDKDCDGVSAWVDGDGDGWAACEDCDDDSRFLYPGAVDRCNEVDDDCDGEIDEDESAADNYPDLDEDGYGDSEAAPVVECDPPEGYVADGTDCDDGDADVNPDQAEWCNGSDDDCDGETDESDAVDARPWFVDADGDGHGEPGDAVQGCTVVSGYSINDYDCDDADPTVSPTATEECGDGIDQDCNGSDRSTSRYYADGDGDGYGDARTTKTLCYPTAGYTTDDNDCDDDDATISPVGGEVCDEQDNDCDGSVDEAVKSTWYEDQDGDGYGSDDKSLEYCVLPYGYAGTGGDCDDSDPALHPGVTEDSTDGLDNDCDGSADALVLADAPATILGAAAYDSIGLSPVGAGDVDGDGFGDLWVDAPGYDGGGSAAGAAMLFRGPLTGSLDLSAADASLLGSAAGDQAGRSIAAADVDLDGTHDVAIGAHRADLGASNAGAVYVVRGGFAGSVDLGDADAIFSGTNADGWAGFSVAFPGDVDDDGWPDLLVGEPYALSGGVDVGAAHLLLGPLSTSRDLDDADASWVGAQTGARAGSTVAGLDANADGVADVAVAAPGMSEVGMSDGVVYLLLDPLGGTGALVDAEVVLTGSLDTAFFGSSLAGGGDADGDGYEDLLVGAPGYAEGGVTEAGAAFLFRGPLTVSGAGASLATSAFYGATAGNQNGTTVAWAGDPDSDGRTDVLVGAIEEDTVGAAYLYRAVDDGSWYAGERGYRMAGDTVSEDVGRGVAGVGDIDGDGLDDFVIGDPLDDTGAEDAGLVRLMLAGALGW